MNDNIYETDTSTSQYCDFHYGEEYFGVKNFPKNSVDLLLPFFKDINTKKVLDLGCAVGRSSFELANHFDEVVAIDYSHKFIEVAKNLQESVQIDFSVTLEGDLSEKRSIDLKTLDLLENKNNITFLQGDAQNLDASLNNFDLIFCSNLIDRLQDPKVFLKAIQSRLSENGVLVLLSPYTWLEEYTPKKNWIGGYEKNGQDVFTLEALKSELLSLELAQCIDVEFVIKETNRKFQHTISQMSIWTKV
ncbi:MAG: putative 4-mercaptohistidine N1-methyltransferase [Campylobacteraceae bacterium]|nr:putative 4-mercaptohistidine N1-methyltransferase [Campylobacteraceae bacterium]